jgi:hypothetical protein
MLIGRVVDHQLGDDPEAQAVRRGDERVEIGQRAVAGMDVLVVRDVVAVVFERGWVERQQPQTVDSQRLEVLQLLRDTGKISDAVVGAVEERADVCLVDDGVLVPQRIVLEHERFRSGQGSGW